MEASVRETGYK